MRSRLSLTHSGDLAEMYGAKLPIKDIAAKLNVSTTAVHRSLAELGLKKINIRGPGRFVDEAEAAKLYQSGESENSLAKHYGISRAAMRAVLCNARADMRTLGQAEALKWSRMTEAQRRRQVEAAHDASRGRSQATDELFKRARLKQQKGFTHWVGKGERELISMLSARGIRASGQVACGKYNIDVGTSSVAVEVHSATSFPHIIPRIRERIKYLIKSGWHVLYIYIPRDNTLDAGAADYVASFHYLASSDPSMTREYRVIRGDGERIPVTDFNVN